MRAFEVLDDEKQGFISEADLTKILTEEGEPFNPEELEELMSNAKAPDKCGGIDPNLGDRAGLFSTALSREHLALLARRWSALPRARSVVVIN